MSSNNLRYVTIRGTEEADAMSEIMAHEGATRHFEHVPRKEEEAVLTCMVQRSRYYHPSQESE